MPLPSPFLKKNINQKFLNVLEFIFDYHFAISIRVIEMAFEHQRRVPSLSLQFQHHLRQQYSLQHVECFGTATYP